MSQKILLSDVIDKLGQNLYQFNTATSGDPGTGKWLLNNADPTLATAAHISDSNLEGTDISDLISNLQIGETIYSVTSDASGTLPDLSTVHRYNVNGALTDNTTYYTVPLTYVNHNGTSMSNDDRTMMVFGFNKATSTASGIIWSFSGIAIGGAPNNNTYYIGPKGATLGATYYPNAFLVPMDCSIKGISLMFSAGNAPTGESTSFYMRANNTTDYTLTTTAQWNGASGTGTGGNWGIGLNNNGFYSNSLINNYSAGDLLSLKMVVPNMTTNPNTVYMGYTVWFEAQ